MIEIGYNFLKKDLNKIQRFKNPTLDIDKNRILKNSKYKIFLNKNQYNNLIKNGNIKYKLTDSKKRMNIQSGDEIASLIQMALPFVKIGCTKSFRNIRIIFIRSYYFFCYK